MYETKLFNHQVQVKLNSKKIFFEKLAQADTQTIQLLAQKIRPEARRIISHSNLTTQDMEEIINDTIVITITAIRKGQFAFKNYHPASYAKGVLRKLIANRLRSKRPKTESLENVQIHSDFNPETYLKNKERQIIVQQLLDKMCENCSKILQLKYFHHMKDKEIIEKKLTIYTTVNALKSKRSQCLKKLAALAKKAGITDVF